MARKKRSIVGVLSVVGVITAVLIPLQLVGTAAATTYGYTGPALGQEIMQLHTTNASGDTDRFFLNGSATPVDVLGNGTGNKKCQLCVWPVRGGRD